MSRKVTNVKEMNDNAMGGHNSDKLVKQYITDIAEYEDEMTEIRGKMKDTLNAAKKNGFSKMAIKKAVKNLRMTEEETQARKEIEADTARFTELCRDLPLFKNAA